MKYVPIKYHRRCYTDFYVGKESDEIRETRPEDDPRTTLVTRKNQKDLSGEEKNLFMSVIDELVQSGQYNIHVNHHPVMSHRMHGLMSGFIGYERFLYWHRVFLLKLEGMMRAIDQRVFIPYWNWVDDREFPEWLKDFTPTGLTDLDGDMLPVTRNPGANGITLPTRLRVDEILSLPDWSSFVRQLEDGPHNRVHRWVGGRMNDIFYSPADPVFWLHHAEVDRIWHIWQLAHSGLGTTITGADAVLDPWAESTTELEVIATLGYSYQEETL